MAIKIVFFSHETRWFSIAMLNYKRVPFFLQLKIGKPSSQPTSRYIHGCPQAETMVVVSLLKSMQELALLSSLAAASVGGGCVAPRTNKASTTFGGWMACLENWCWMEKFHEILEVQL